MKEFLINNGLRVCQAILDFQENLLCGFILQIYLMPFTYTITYITRPKNESSTEIEVANCVSQSRSGNEQNKSSK